MTDLPKRLRAARKRRELTQEEAASILGVTGNTLSRWERGIIGIHPARVESLERWIKGE